MEQESERKTAVTGHRNLGTDSIYSVICYVNLKRAIIGDAYIPARVGHVNGETKFVLDYFGMEEPKPVEDVRTQIENIEIRKTGEVTDNISLEKAWNIMQGNDVVTIPSVGPDGTLGGLITMGDTTEAYMSIYGSSTLSKAYAQHPNIIETLEADIVVENADAYFDRGKVLITAANPDLMESYTESHNLITLGNRYESQFYVIEMGTDCIIVCEGVGVSTTIKKIAQDRECAVTATTYDTYAAAHLINQSIPVSYFMTKEYLITFNSDDYTDETREIVASERYRDFPILNEKGKYLGIISRQDLLGTKSKQAVLVGHNEKSQAVAGIESTEIMGTIDHYRLGTVQTTVPAFFRNQPLGCITTIIYQMYLENEMEIGPKIAGLLCNAIMSDTLLFRSPICTPVDEMATRSLAAIAGLDIEKYATEMFEAGGNPKDKSDEETLYQSSKKFSVGKALIGAGQIIPLNDIKLGILKEKTLGYMEEARESNSLDMILSMLTNILKELMDLICYGQGTVQLAAKAFHLDIGEAVEKPEPVLSLPETVSREKQLIPELMLTEQGQVRQGQED